MVEAIREGYKALLENDNSEAAVETAINIMENSPAFNAGTGSVLTATGEVEMDACIINGTDLTAGAVGAVRHVKNPISLAKLVKDKSGYVFLVGYEAEMFALNNGVGLVPTSDLIANWNETLRQEFSEKYEKIKVNCLLNLGAQNLMLELLAQ
jgi:beta-aspartyl-peptidase (threonine type)